MKVETPFEVKMRVLGHPLNNLNVVFRYIFYIVLALFLMLLFGLSTEGMHIDKDNSIGRILGVLLIFSPILLVVWLERHILKFRKEFGLPLYKGVWKETHEIMEKLERERNSIIVEQKSVEVDKSDIGYWFSLLEKGAISKDEYETKKSELMG